jgi:hypothetical protein
MPCLTPLEPRRKRGVCRLCGEFAHLTKTHVPAKSAGNVGTAQPPMIAIDEAGGRTYALADERLGGMWGYWFCATCNNNSTRPWDEEYTRWVPALFSALHDPLSCGNTVEATAEDFDAGAFVRCLWAWFFAACGGLRERIPEVAAAVRSGESVEPPDYPRLYLAATRELQFSMQIGRVGAGIAAPPYVAFVATAVTEALGRRMLDTDPWLRRSAGGHRHETLRLPIIETLGGEQPPMLGHAVLD